MSKNAQGGNSMIKFSPFPNLETERLILRRLSRDDSDHLYEMRKDPRMHVHTDTIPDKSIDDTKAYIDKMNKGIDANKWIIWAMAHRQSQKVIGSISLWNIDSEDESGELGYGIIPDFQGQGLMKEALLAVVDYGLNVMNLQKINAYTEENNLSSTRLLDKCNFVEFDRIYEKGKLFPG